MKACLDQEESSGRTGRTLDLVKDFSVAPPCSTQHGKPYDSQKKDRYSVDHRNNLGFYYLLLKELLSSLQSFHEDP